MKGISKTVSIIGVGRLGGALALALSRNGFHVDHLFARNRKIADEICKLITPKPIIEPSNDFSKINSDIILITTQDSEIESIANQLAQSALQKKVVLHTSGSISSHILKIVKKSKVGSIHPLVSISDAVAGAEMFRDVFFGVEGDFEAIKIGKEIVGAFGGKPFLVNSESKALYHAAAVTACGHLVALIDTANEMLESSGVDEAKTSEILMPLIRSTLANLESQNRSEALTGTFARLDLETFDRHVAAIEKYMPNEFLELYLQLGQRSLHLVNATEFSSEKLSEMQEKISLAKRNTKC